MKIDFEDGSFIMFENFDDRINIIMCARKDNKTTTMTSSTIKKEEAQNIMNFLSDWIKKN